MKEIKFRAWYGQKMHYSQDGYMRDFADVFFDSFECKIMQYIGVQDINGKDVYEGDIVKFYNRLLRVGYDYITTAFRLYENNEAYKLAGICHISEVVGNIYENPDLLKKESEV